MVKISYLQVNVLDELYEAINSNEFNSNNQFIGRKAPEINEGELIKKFIYAFNFLGISRSEALSIGDIESILKKSLMRYEDNQNSSLENSKKWWFFVFEFLKRISSKNELFFSENTAEYIQNKVITLSEKELSYYANIINNSIFREVSDTLRVRPNMLTEVDSDVLNKDINFRVVFGVKDALLDAVKIEFNIEEFKNNSFLKEIEMCSDLGYLKDKWEIFFEVYLSYLSSLLYSKSSDGGAIGVRDLTSIASSALVSLLKFVNKDQENKVKTTSVAIANLIYNGFLKK